MKNEDLDTRANIIWMDVYMHIHHHGFINKVSRNIGYRKQTNVHPNHYTNSHRCLLLPFIHHFTSLFIIFLSAHCILQSYCSSISIIYIGWYLFWAFYEVFWRWLAYRIQESTLSPWSQMGEASPIDCDGRRPCADLLRWGWCSNSLQ